MKIFLDSANLDEIRQAKAFGVIEGITTSPSLLAKEKGDWKKVVRQLCKEIDGPVNVSVLATEAQAMLAEARDLVKIAPNIVIMVPITLEGLKALSELHHRGVETNATLVFSPSQALLAAKAGASFVSPFLGRLDETGQDGIQVLQDIMTVFRNYDLSTQVLAASIRHANHFSQTAMAGADAATIPLSVLLSLTGPPLTGIGQATAPNNLAKW